VGFFFKNSWTTTRASHAARRTSALPAKIKLYYPSGRKADDALRAAAFQHGLNEIVYKYTRASINQVPPKSTKFDVLWSVGLGSRSNSF
jgi:hypothetical protein